MVAVSSKCLVKNKCQFIFLTPIQNVLDRCPRCIEEMFELIFFFSCDTVEDNWISVK